MSGAFGPVPEAQELWDVISRLYELHRHKPKLSPTWFATEAMKLIRFAPTDHRQAYLGCHLAFREIARAFFRQKFDPLAPVVDGQSEMEFAETLQERYPLRTQPGEERVYVLLTELPDPDLTFNVTRMRKQAKALQKHADALEAYGLNRSTPKAAA